MEALFERGHDNVKKTWRIHAQNIIFLKNKMCRMQHPLCYICYIYMLFRIYTIEKKCS